MVRANPALCALATLTSLLCVIMWATRPAPEVKTVLLTPQRTLHRRFSVPRGHSVQPESAPQPGSSTPHPGSGARLPRQTFELGEAIDVSVTGPGGPTALRRVARQRAVEMAHGPELLTLFTDLSGGGALALNALLNIHALGYRHHLVGGYTAGVCAGLGAALRRLPAERGRDEILRTPCVRDSWWESHVHAKGRTLALSTRSGGWFVRWSIVARLVRLGYNVLNVDADVALLDDILPHLQSRLLCGRFTLMFASDYDVRNTSSRTPRTARLESYTSHRTPGTAHLAPHISHRTPRI